MDTSGYWDDFPERVQETVDAINNKDAPIISRLTVHVTESCNLKCSYCNTHQSNRELSCITILGLALELFKCNPRATIHFTGGEPTVHKGIEKVLAFCKKLGLTTSMNTNCVKKIDVSNVDKLKVSLDTLDYDLQEIWQGKRNLSLIHENLLKYSEEMEDKILSVTALVGKENFRYMPFFAEDVIRYYNPHNIYFTAYKGTDLAFCLSDEERSELFNSVIPKTLYVFEKYAQEYSYKQLAMYKEQHFREENRFPENKIIPCYIQMTELVVDPSGRFHNCSHLYRDHVYGKNKFYWNELYSVSNAFKALKNTELQVPISNHCFVGCNPNLVAFNCAVHNKLERMII